MTLPDFSLERETQSQVCGIDEAGRGSIAGSVVAACVYVPKELYGLPLWKKVNDSKKLSKLKRNELYGEIMANSLWGIGHASAREVDNVNILQATFLAMKRAFVAMGGDKNMCALIDGNQIPKDFPAKSRSVVKGDTKSISIAAASILAKVARDRIMEGLAEKFPEYGWDSNAGYPTKAHLEALKRCGVNIYHRNTFAPLKKR